jgi:hypothetical protein
MGSDRLLGIDKRFVDFRRKPKELLTDDDKNEGVRASTITTTTFLQASIAYTALAC